MGTEIYEVNFNSCTSVNECYRKIKNQILYNKFENFTRTDRNVARAKFMYDNPKYVFPNEIPKELTELNNAYKRCASEQLKLVVLDLARKEKLSIAKANNTTVKTENLFAVEENDSKLMRFYKEKLFKNDGIITEELLNELEELVDFSALDKDEKDKSETLESFINTQTSVNKFLDQYDVGLTELTNNHKDVIKYNEEANDTSKQAEQKRKEEQAQQEKNANEIIVESLDIDDKTVEKIEKAIDESKTTSEQKAKAIRDAVEKLVAEEVDEKTATEKTYADAYKKYDLLVKYSLADKYGFRTREYMDAREKNYADKIFEKIDPQAEAKYVKDKFDALTALPPPESEGERNMYLENAAAHIKHLKEVHAKRGFWTRFTDWFKSNGEDSTIKAMEKRLKEVGYGSKEISNAIKTTTATVSGSFHEYEIKTDKQNVTFFDEKTKQKIEGNILHPENLAKYKVSDFFNQLEQTEHAIEDNEKYFEENNEFIDEEKELSDEEQKQSEEQEFKNNIVASIKNKTNDTVSAKIESEARETNPTLENSKK